MKRMGGNRAFKANSQCRWRSMVKRVLDGLCATVGLVAMSPVLAITALLIRETMGTPVLFCQERPGRYGRPFTLVKFRTMRNSSDSHGRLLPDGERLTR